MKKHQPSDISPQTSLSSMDKDQLISMIHFLEERDKASAQENQVLKDMLKELTANRKKDLETQTKLMQRVDLLMNQVTDLSTQNRMISERIAELAQAFPSRD